MTEEARQTETGSWFQHSFVCFGSRKIEPGKRKSADHWTFMQNDGILNARVSAEEAGGER